MQWATRTDPIWVGQQVQLGDGRSVKVVGYDQFNVKVKLPDDSQTTVPMSALAVAY